MTTLPVGEKVRSHSDTSTSGSARPLYVLALLLIIGLALPAISSATGLYDHVQHWGKGVHAVDGFIATLIFGLLLLGWRAQASVELVDELAALLTMFFGILFGILWEIVEFLRDWVAYSDLQKSNTDTMTDFLCNDVAVVLAALVALRVYCHVLVPADRQRLGVTAEWLVDGPSRVLDRHGFALLTLAVGVIAVSVLLLWFAGRPVPGIPIP
jgi:hypothetical protein